MPNFLEHKVNDEARRNEQITNDEVNGLFPPSDFVICASSFRGGIARGAEVSRGANGIFAVADFSKACESEGKFVSAGRRKPGREARSLETGGGASLWR